MVSDGLCSRLQRLQLFTLWHAFSNFLEARLPLVTVSINDRLLDHLFGIFETVKVAREDAFEWLKHLERRRLFAMFVVILGRACVKLLQQVKELAQVFLCLSIN